MQLKVRRLAWGLNQLGPKFDARRGAWTKYLESSKQGVEIKN